MSVDPNDAYNVQTGHPLIVTVGEHHLADAPQLWEEVWAEARDELLSDWIGGHPGTRPPAWWRFDCAEQPAEGESEFDALHRLGELAPAEVEAIRARALELVAHDRGRRPEKPSTNFIPPDNLHKFAAKHGLLDPSERAVLRLDEHGRYQYADRHPRWET